MNIDKIEEELKLEENNLKNSLFNFCEKQLSKAILYDNIMIKGDLDYRGMFSEIYFFRIRIEEYLEENIIDEFRKNRKRIKIWNN